ncbi:hypothetical protein Q1695_006729 [Nippostrongylus brasiliensis]|nr:hypothetical protein Q1695_006729 [Nippostrongylus brasiliensis]
MTSVLTYDSLRLHSSTKNEQSEDDLLFSKFRVRLCKSEDVPILKDYSGVRQTEIILVDLPPNKDDELDSIRTEQFGDHQTPMEVDTGSGDGPLVFNFLSLAVLEQRCDTDDKRLAMKRPIMSSSYLECNPLDAPTAFAVRDRLLRGNLTSGMDDKLSAVPVWIVVNAKDHLGTTFVGSHLTNSKVSTFHTRCLGRYGEQCKSTIKLLDARFQGELEAKSKALALYSVLDKNVSPAWGSGRYLSKMTLTFKWDAKAANYLCAPPPSASAVFYFSPGWKDKRVALVEATEQLEYLLMMANVLDSGSEMVWPSGTDGVQDAILSDVRQLIAEHKVQNNDAERTAHGMRHVDFTELLWDILKRCTDYKTLVAALNVVFDALKQCRINAILHEDNKSSIARLMRDAQSQDLMLPRLEALTPIQILLEIGYERFRRDMVQAYVTAGFMTNDTDLDLKPQLNSSPENRTRALLPLHLALQTMLEMKQYLALPAHTLASTTRSVIAKYSSSPITDITKVFYETAVSFIHVQPELLKKLPDLWTYETTYSHGSSVVAQTFIHFTRDIKLRFLESKVSFEREDGDEDQENQDRESAFVCTYTTASF